MIGVVSKYMGKKKRHANRKTVSRRSASITCGRKNEAEAVKNSLNASSLRGLVNLGNTCFLNSCIQSLNAVIDQVDETRHSRLYSSLCSILLALRGNGSAKKAANPSQLLSSVSAGYLNFKDRRQHDAHELLVHLISGLQDEEREGKKEELNVSNNLDLEMSYQFSGSLISIIECKCCGHRSCSTESFIDISLPIPGSSHLFKSRTMNAAKKSSQSQPKNSLPRRPKPDPFPTPPTLVPESGASDDTPTKDEGGQEHGLVDKSSEIGQQASLSVSVGGTGGESIVDTDDESVDSTEHDDDDTDVADLPLPLSEEAVVYDVFEPPDELWELSGGVNGEGLSASLSVYGCLRAFTARESLLESEGNGIACSACVKSLPPFSVVKRDATKRVLLLQEALPPVLGLHLKRLLPGGKFSGHIDFDMILDVLPFVGKKIPTSTCENVGGSGCVVDNGDSAPLCRYGLRAVIVHKGGGMGGHYVAYVCREGVWYYTSDLTTRPVCESEVLKCEAYMLLYRQLPAEVQEGVGEDEIASADVNVVGVLSEGIENTEDVDMCDAPGSFCDETVADVVQFILDKVDDIVL